MNVVIAVHGELWYEIKFGLVLSQGSLTRYVAPNFMDGSHVLRLAPSPDCLLFDCLWKLFFEDAFLESKIWSAVGSS